VVSVSRDPSGVKSQCGLFWRLAGIGERAPCNETQTYVNFCGDPVVHVSDFLASKIHNELAGESISLPSLVGRVAAKVMTMTSMVGFGRLFCAIELELFTGGGGNQF
jgi:hypothetical protein